jgi:hypothetical protein
MHAAAFGCGADLCTMRACFGSPATSPPLPNAIASSWPVHGSLHGLFVVWLGSTLVSWTAQSNAQASRTWWSQAWWQGISRCSSVSQSPAAAKVAGFFHTLDHARSVGRHTASTGLPRKDQEVRLHGVRGRREGGWDSSDASNGVRQLLAKHAAGLSHAEQAGQRCLLLYPTASPPPKAKRLRLRRGHCCSTCGHGQRSREASSACRCLAVGPSACKTGGGERKSGAVAWRDGDGGRLVFRWSRTRRTR